MLCISMAVPSIAGDLCFFIFQVIAPGTDVVVFNVPLSEDSKTTHRWHRIGTLEKDFDATLHTAIY